MNKIKLIGVLVGLAFIFNSYGNSNEKNQDVDNNQLELTETHVDSTETENLKLGAFSISLNVKDLKTSKEFYEKLGFTILGGAMEQNYLIMKNENALIGLFQGMFEGNILTFNPGWDENGKDIEHFNDIREIQEHLNKGGIETGEQIDPKTTGPASMMITDPDGNVIYIDQHR
jgi:catechol 2,3-dioxygenase-like lactoylglutathione lyase family enzyme